MYPYMPPKENKYADSFSMPDGVDLCGQNRVREQSIGQYSLWELWLIWEELSRIRRGLVVLRTQLHEGDFSGILLGVVEVVTVVKKAGAKFGILSDFHGT